jgi:anti-sigma regulatory factor (Ser/Thr protein kinase)
MDDRPSKAVPSPLDADVQVPDRPDSIPAARAFLARLLDGWGVAAEVIDDASLMTSELMSNAVKHGSGAVNLEIEVTDGLLRVGVHDDDLETPVVRDVSTTRTDGRGMWIVQSLARDWGSESTGTRPGKTVWFELVALRSPTDQAMP